MTPDANKATVQAYVEAMNAGDFQALRDLFTHDAEVHGVMGWGSVDFAMPVWRDLHRGLRMRLEIEDISAEGDRVAVRYTERGVWVGPFLGHDNPSGKSYELSAMEWFEMRDGRIRRRWGARDSASQARQIGL